MLVLRFSAAIMGCDALEGINYDGSMIVLQHWNMLMLRKGCLMKTIKNLWDGSFFDRYFFGILLAIELLMSFTFLGYIHIPPISVTIAYVPILVAGCLYGPEQSVVLGIVFGTASMYKASASYVLPADAAFSPVLSGSPISSLLLGVGTRALFGFIVGMAFHFVRERKHYRLWIGMISGIAPKIHSLLVYTAMGILFPELGYRYDSAFHWDFNNTVYMIICIVVVELFWTIYHSDTLQDVKLCIDQSVNNPYAPKKMNLFFAAFEFFVLCMSVFAAIYFSQRESYTLEQHGVMVSDQISSDLLLLQIQFLIASLSLNAISVILLVSTYKYMSYKEYQGEIDEVTGVMGRKIFLYHCEKAQKANGSKSERTGWFLFVDADYFKEINDTFGHSAGDKVLREIASNLQDIFDNDGKVGRIGGDEFAVMIEKPMTGQELKRRLERFLESISGALPDKKVTCSIGAYQFVFPQSVKHLLLETDTMLYEAKENGRACYRGKELNN